MIALLTVVLEKIGDAFLGALVGKVTDEVQTKLKSDPAKTALKHALGTAIQRYATSQLRFDLAHSLLEKDGFLTHPAIANEVTQLVRFEREPNAKLIGQQWKASMDNPPPWCDFTYEAKRLLEYLQVELRSTEVFRPVFDAKSLDAIAASAAASTKSLAHIEAQLADLAQLLAARFSNLSRAFAGASFDVREQIRDYTRFIQEKTHGFVGRRFVFDAIARFIDTQPRGYYFIRGDPGIGKSALVAQMVRTHGYVHHFNIRSEGINKTDTFLRNICAQLIAVYQLNHTFLLPETTQDTSFLNSLLEEVSNKLGPQEKAIIVIDALDEVDMLGLSPGVNPLYLPVMLPQGIYVIITSRKIPINLRIDCEQGILDIEHDSAGNIADIREYVERAVVRPGIQAYIATQGIDNELFVDHLIEKSEGNFMYLHYVLPEIEHGYYTNLGLEALPVGLQNYYEDHWRRMSSKDQNSWFEYELPIIATLTAVHEPVSIEFISYITAIPTPRVSTILIEWAQFLHSEAVKVDNIYQERYRTYHMSFQDFLAQKKAVKSELNLLQEARRNIAKSLLQRKPNNE